MLRSSLAGAVALALSLSSSFALAQDGTSSQELDRVVVTGTRTAITVDDSLAAVEVIDRKEIERTQAHSLPELLRGRAGINLVNQGGAGKLSTLFMRGAESDHVLFLVDGVRVGSSTSGLTAIQDIPVELIDRVEIVRGPRSSLYGSDAIGGVIQIFTRKAQNGVRPHFRLGAGTDDLRELSAGIDFGFERAWFGADYSHQATEGFQSCLGAATPVFAGCFVDNPDPDRDGYESNAISLRGGVRPIDGLVIEGNALRNQGRNEYDSDPFYGLPDVSNTTQQVVGGKIRYDVGRTTWTMSAGSNRDVSYDSRDRSFVDQFASQRDSASLQGDVRVADGHTVTAGFDWQRDKADVEDLFSAWSADRNNHAVFGQYLGDFGANNVQASLRRDDNEQFGGHTTGGLAWGYAFAHDLRLTASVGTAFKAPTFNELYFPFFGNPDLRPEESKTWELGIGQRKADWNWALNAYQTKVDDLIVYDISLFMANNLDSARIRGAELTGGLTLGGWNLSGAASYVDPRNHSQGFDYDNLLPRRARTTGRIDADRAFGDFSVGATLVGEGRRWDDVANTLAVGGFSTLDLRAEWRASPEWTLQARVGNAFDKDYQTSAYYAQPGRQWFLSVRYAAQ
ncbi:TonB-dependent vitamin B12 receptor [Lysobacter sp. KIS68-7]|uniref:TonB-dependent vitamin B12 receptor n=1 Tax=Lysobacter sp. KIS68-7 TaxID=2904252 RepID=UPI001E5ABC48|nr:TonB-dependent vitamin B12 receptor [Lysobacter sp. KIS68-7]UHQ20743.1 TonB-dependent vitamin B12 receptor [Lysobacter sp. KIS68-7]